MNATSNAREVAALVPMFRLLEALGFDVNERTRRAPCVLHGGSNRSAFSWTEKGLWKCHSCGQGGDRIALVRAVRKCSFRDAVELLAALAGAEFCASRASRAEIKQLQAEQLALRRDASGAVVVDTALWLETRHTVLQLEAIRRNAGRRLMEIFEGSRERWCGETEWCWAALAEVASQMPHVAAVYAIASFGKFSDRLRFVFDRAFTEELIGETLESGYVTDEHGHRFEVRL